MALVAAVLAVGMGGLAVPLLVPAGPAYATATCSSATVSITRISSPVLYLDTSVTPNVNSAYEGYRLTNGSGSAYEDLWVTSGSFAGPQIHLATYSTGRTHLGTLANGATGYAFFYLTASAATSSSESHTISVYTTRPDLASGPLCTTTVSLDATSDIAASANKVSSVTVAPSTPSLGGSLTITVVGDAGTIGSAGIFATTPASYATWRADAFKLTGAQVTIGGSTYQNTLYLSGLATGGAYTAVFTFAATGTTASSTSVSPMSHISSGTQIKHTSIDSTYQALSPIVSPANNTTLSVSASPTTLSSSGGTVTYTVTVVNAGATTTVSLDDITVTLASGETYSTGTATFNSAAASDPSTSGSTLTFVDKYPVPAGTSRTLTWQVSVPGTAGTYTTSVVGHVGTTQIDTSVSTSTDSPASASVTVAAPPPTVSAVSPGSGTDHGGTSVTVSGTNFVGVTAVTFGSTAASTYTVNSATSITVTTPAASAGTVDVTVTTISGTSATSSADQYTFTAPPNHPPVFTGAATNTSQSVAYGAGLTAVAATDPDSDPLTYSVNSGTLPTGITLGSDGTFTGTTTTPGDTTVVIGVSDGFGGTATTTLAVHVATPAPTVTSINPTSGTTAGGTSVTITGTWLTGATAVSFGSTAASSFVVNGATSITATSPAGSAGTVDVTVTTPAGTSSTGSADHYTYLVPNRAPTFTNAATNTSQSVAYGAGLTAVAATDADSDPLTYSVSSGTLPAGITLNSDGTFTGSTTTPGDTTVVIGVSDGRGGTDTTTLAVHVATPAPTVTAVSPSTGTTAGGTSVTITGTWFTGATAVSFGSTAASSFVVNSATSITATSPAGNAGTVDVTVTTPAGTSTTGSADHYTYLVPNRAPTFTNAATNTSQSVPYGAGLTALAATDQDGDTLTFTLTSGTLPAGITLGSDGTFAGATTTPGDTSVVIGVSDGRGGTDTTTLAVHVATPAPAVTAVSPSTGTTAGGTAVTITGTWFTGATAVSFGSTAASSFVVNNATSITATAPAESAGTVDVTVTTPAGTSTTGSADHYTYTAADQPPAYTGAASNTSQTVGVGTALAALAATDPDSDPLTFALASGTLPAGVTVNTDGTFAGTTTTPGNTTAVISVSDGRGGTASTTLVVHVLPAPTVAVDGGTTAWTIDPTPTISGTTTAADGSTVTVTIDGQTLTTTVSSGAWTVTATVLADGTYPVVVTVTDPIAGTGTAAQQLAIDTQPPPVVPVATTGTGTQLQTVTIDIPTSGSVTLLVGGSPVTSVTLPGQGIYSLDPATGVISFAPVLGFTGPATPVTFRVIGGSATVTSYYTATVIAPAPPATPPRATVGPATQSVSITLPPGGTITLLDAHGNPVTTLVVRHIGTYHVATTESAPIELALLPTLHRAMAESAPPPVSAIITFTPVPGFTGTAPPVTFRLTDAYGQQVTATYTPTVTPQSLTLPTTGPDITDTVTLGLWLIVAGLAMVVSRPRRWLW